MAYGPKQKQARLYRGQIPSPGRPTVAWREDRVRFWSAVARGVKTEDACVEARVSGPVGFRWFRHHPRERGEHDTNFIDVPAAAGPPPRARGAHVAAAGRNAVAGTTPASAGSTPPGGSPTCTPGDHPRERGEHSVT